MSIEKLWTMPRAARLTDPTIQNSLDEEKARVRESFGRLGGQTKETCTSILYNTFINPIKSMVNEKNPGVLASKTVTGGFDSTKQIFTLVGRVLMATGRVAKYGVRKALAI